MRLIDADEFKKQIAGMAIINNYPPDKANKMCELIDSQKTAYDANEVVERIKRLSVANYVEKGKVLEIVKSGGIG